MNYAKANGRRANGRSLPQAAPLGMVVLGLLSTSPALAKTVDLGTEEHDAANSGFVREGIAGTFKVSFDTKAVVRDDGLTVVTLNKLRVAGIGRVHHTIDRMIIACLPHEYYLAAVKTFDAQNHVIKDLQWPNIELKPIEPGTVQKLFDVVCR